MSAELSGLGAPPGGTSVAEYGRLLRRFWWILAVCTVAGVAAGLGYVMTGPSTYTSTTTVLVGDTGIASTDVANSRTTSGELNLDTEAQIVTSGTVGERAAEILGYQGNVYGLRGKVAVRVPPNSGVLLVDFTASDAASAKRGSTAFAQAYLDNREATAQSALDGRTDRLTGSLGELREELTEASRNAADTKSVQARSEVAQLSQQIRAASSALAAVSLQEIDPGDIISQASPAKSAGTTSLLLFAVGAGFLGLITGLGIAVLCDRLRVGSVGLDDLQAMRPGTAHVVRATGASGLVGDAEARRMWAWLGRMAPGDLDAVVVCSAGDAAALSARTALVLAEARAEDGDPVVFANTAAQAEDALVDDGVFASLPVNARSAKLNRVGESSLLLAVAGPKSQSLPGHVGGMLRWLARSADTVVLHVSPLPDSVEAVDVASDVDVVVVVVQLGRTPRRELDASLDMVRTFGGAPTAVVAVPAVKRVGRLLRASSSEDAATDPRRLRRAGAGTVVGKLTSRTDDGTAKSAGRS
jgi:capsular polysaccharide biosynthesis protein